MFDWINNMTPFTTLTAIATPFGGRNIDTDVIIPARFLKAVTKEGMGKGAFYTLRFNEDGSAKADSLFDSPRNSQARILIAGENFGCGSSREHAAWALDDLGYKVIIAPSYSDIFSGNAFKNGLLGIVLPQDQIDQLMAIAGEVEITIDLENQVVTTPFQHRFAFEIDPFRKHCLLNGLDEISLTLQAADKIKSYETALRISRPWIDGAAGRAV
jgi:3-isopropylmalate/(R)-2-methylmalate dehydratase small subunit